MNFVTRAVAVLTSAAFLLASCGGGGGGSDPGNPPNTQPPPIFAVPSQQALTAADVGALGFDQVEGGLQGMVLVGPDDGKVYSLSLRPLLPDEPDTKG